MKRVFHYLILAAVLIGMPLGCAWIAGKDEILSGVAAFPPRTEDWGAAEYWQQRCPFNWTMFVALAAVVVAVMWTFARKSWKNGALASARDARRVGYGFPWWGWLGSVMFLGWLPVSARNWYFINMGDCATSVEALLVCGWQGWADDDSVPNDR